VQEHEARTVEGNGRYMKATNDGAGGVLPMNLPPYIASHQGHTPHTNHLLKRKEEVSRATQLLSTSSRAALRGESKNQGGAGSPNMLRAPTNLLGGVGTPISHSPINLVPNSTKAVGPPAILSFGSDYSITKSTSEAK